jgi:hypothetical protein
VVADRRRAAQLHQGALSPAEVEASPKPLPRQAIEPLVDRHAVPPSSRPPSLSTRPTSAGTGSRAQAWRSSSSRRIAAPTAVSPRRLRSGAEAFGLDHGLPRGASGSFAAHTGMSPQTPCRGRPRRAVPAPARAVNRPGHLRQGRFTSAAPRPEAARLTSRRPRWPPSGDRRRPTARRRGRRSGGRDRIQRRKPRHR